MYIVNYYLIKLLPRINHKHEKRTINKYLLNNNLTGPTVQHFLGLY